MPTRRDCIQTAGALLAEQDAINAARTPRELAEAAWTPSSPLSVDEIEDAIRADRGLPPLRRRQPA